MNFIDGSLFPENQEKLVITVAPYGPEWMPSDFPEDIPVSDPTVLIVPGLRDHVAEHWQTLLAARLQAAGCNVRSVPPMGRDDLDCARRVAAIEREARAVEGPIVIVAHSGGCVMVVHWARQTRRAVHAALLATPPEFDRPLPAGYPTIEQLDAGGWLPVPREQLPFRSIVAASRNDPLAHFDGVTELARDWGSELVDLGNVGHLNPAYGFGHWPQAEQFIRQLTGSSGVASVARDQHAIEAQGS